MNDEQSHASHTTVNGPAMLTVQQAAHLLGRSDEVLRRWLRQGLVRAERIQTVRGAPVWGIPISALAEAAPLLAAKPRWGQRRSRSEMRVVRQLPRGS